MKYVDEFRDPEAIKAMSAKLASLIDRPTRVMEVCGTHTMSIFRNGLRSLFPPELTMVSGPGCPVCVTSSGEIDRLIAISTLPDTRIAIFGDLFRVPGSKGSLALAASRGAKVDIVYSPADALDIALKHPDKHIVFAGIGFETTTPSVAATILAARAREIKNFRVLSLHKTMMPALLALFQGDGGENMDALLCPGHVSAITGTDFYRPITEIFNIPCVIGGFEPADIMAALVMTAKQLKEKRADVENAYPRAVTTSGNPRARLVTEQVFRTTDAEWRGLGKIRNSGLAIREEFRDFDALFITPPGKYENLDPPGCRCGEILRGVATPDECPLFGKACAPEKPAGPCMVSGEGTCAAYYRYGMEKL
jgi:hydrogenase expression/formation protein HypD